VVEALLVLVLRLEDSVVGGDSGEGGVSPFSAKVAEMHREMWDGIRQPLEEITSQEGLST